MLFLTCALGLSGLIGAQACSSDATVGGGAGSAGEAGAVGEAGAKAAGGSTSHAGTGGEAGSTAGAAGEGGEGGASAGTGGEGGSSELTQAELCDQFCTGDFVTCTGDLKQYTDEATCLTACNGYARGMVGDTIGDTLDCRIYHLNAAMTLPATHCPHTTATPTAFCIN